MQAQFSAQPDLSVEPNLNLVSEWQAKFSGQRGERCPSLFVPGIQTTLWVGGRRESKFALLNRSRGGHTRSMGRRRPPVNLFTLLDCSAKSVGRL